LKVIANESIYEMGRKEYRGVLKAASKQIPCGIYAVEKDGICELRKDTFDSKEELKKAVAEYAAKGFKVYYNSQIGGFIMTTFKTGDIVICKKHSVAQKLVCDSKGIRIENYIDDYFFNREAVIENTYKEAMEERFKNDLHEELKDEEEYIVRFLGDNTTLAWLKAEELVLKIPREQFIGLV